MRKNYFFGLLIAMLAIILPTKSVFAQETVVEPEVTYTLTTERLSASDLMAATEPVYIAIKNVSATNNYYYVGNTGGVPYSKPEFSDDAVFVWEPMVAGVAGTAYVLKKLDGTVMTSTSPTTFSADSGAGAVFAATNPTVANGEFNGDSDSQSYIDDQSLLVRFVVGGTTGTTWINVQNGNEGTPVYNSGKGGWTVHNVYKVAKEQVEVVPPAEPDAEVVAEVEALLALNGVGYPNATENATLQAALDAYTSNVSGETLAALNAAVEAYYATTNITLPESDKYYTITAVAPNGNELYIDYNGTELVLVERTADTVLPESAQFKFESNADGSYRIWATEDLYLVYSHGENSNISWMTGASKTGIQDKNNATALTEMGNITFSKFSYTAEAEDIFGLVQWSSYRGFKTETNALEPGVLVIKHSASDFDGANGTFFNEDFTSALRLEEVEVAAPSYKATVSVNDETMGTATVEIVDGVATFTATANEGYKFVTWMLESDGELMDTGNTTNPLSLPLDADYALQAKFEAEAVVEPAARESFDKAYAAAADILATVQTEVTKSEVALTTEAGQPGYVSSPHDHAVINPTSQWDMGGIAALIDGTKLHFHTAWENVPAGPHYFQVDMGEGESIEAFVFETLNRDDAGYDFPSEFTIKGSNDDVDYELISVVDASASAANGATFESNVITASKPYRYLRFEVTNCISTGDNNQTGYRTYFHIAEFDLFKAEVKVSEQYADLQRAYDAAANNADADDATLEGYTKALNDGIHFVTAYEWVGEYKVQANVTDLTTDWTTPSPLSFEVATEFRSWKNATDIILKSFAGVDVKEAAGSYGSYPTITISEDGKSGTINNARIYLSSEIDWDTYDSESVWIIPAEGANITFTLGDDGVVSISDLKIEHSLYTSATGSKTNTDYATLTDVYAGKEGVQLPGVPAELTVEKVTPDAPVASLETIEIHFSDVTTVKVPNSAAVKDATGADVGWFMSREIDGKVQRLTLMPAITTPGTYTLTIPADVIKNEAGVFYAGGTFEFTVEKQLVVTATSNDEALGTAAVVLEGNIASFSASPAAGSALVNWTVNGEEVTRELRFAAEVSEDVEVVANFVADPYQHITGNSTNGNRRWDSFTITNEENSLEIKDIQKTNQSNMYAYRVDHVLEVKAGDVIYFSDFYFAGEWTHAYAYIDYNNDKVFGTDLNPYGETEGELVSFNYLEGVDSFGGQSSAQYAMSNSYDDSKGLPGFILPEGIAPGEYRMRIKTDWNNTDPNGDSVIRTNGGCQCDFTIKVVGDEPVKEYLEIADVTPASGTTVDKLEYILVTFGPDDYVMNNIHGVDVMGADGVKVGYADIVFKKEDGSTVAGNELVLKLQEAIAETGTYTITLPEGAFGDGIKNTAERTLTFTVDPTTGIDGVDAEVEQVIYDITGRRIEKITNAGVYIVNGVKVLVK